MGDKKTEGGMKMNLILKEAWALVKEKKFLHLINSAWAAAWASIYFGTFIFSFEGKNIDTDMTHAVLLIKTFLVAIIIMRSLTYAIGRSANEDELSKTIRQDALQFSHIFLVTAIIGSLLSWSFHKSTATSFHFTFLSLTVSYALYHFISSIKHMSFMAKPSLFELDNQE